MKQKDFKQLDLMRQGVDYSFEIACRQFKVRVRPLTCLEIIQATSAAAEAYEKLPQAQRISVTASLLNAMHQLECASAGDVGEEPQLTLAHLQMMSPDEINHLWKQYVRVTDRVNPSLEEMTKEELDKLVEALKKSSDPASILIDLSISNLIALCLRLREAVPA